VTEMTALAGTMGRHYALAEGQPPDVAEAIFESVLPRQARVVTKPYPTPTLVCAAQPPARAARHAPALPGAACSGVGLRVGSARAAGRAPQAAAAGSAVPRQTRHVTAWAVDQARSLCELRKLAEPRWRAAIMGSALQGSSHEGVTC